MVLGRERTEQAPPEELAAEREGAVEFAGAAGWPGLQISPEERAAAEDGVMDHLLTPPLELAHYEYWERKEWEKLAAQAETIYATLAARLEAEHCGQVVVIDVRSGDYVVAADNLTATLRMFERRPKARNWGRTIGGEGDGAPFRPVLTFEYL